MVDIATYKIVSSGKFIAGFEPDKVVKTFSRVFKISTEKAAQALKHNRILKKGLPIDEAEVYRKRFAEIGVAIKLEPEISDYTLRPLEKAELENASDQPQSSRVVCSVCNFRQLWSNRCTHCGSFLAKDISATSIELHPVADSLVDTNHTVTNPHPNNETQPPVVAQAREIRGDSSVVRGLMIGTCIFCVAYFLFI